MRHKTSGPSAEISQSQRDRIEELFGQVAAPRITGGVNQDRNEPRIRITDREQWERENGSLYLRVETHKGSGVFRWPWLEVARMLYGDFSRWRYPRERIFFVEFRGYRYAVVANNSDQALADVEYSVGGW